MKNITLGFAAAAALSASLIAALYESASFPYRLGLDETAEKNACLQRMRDVDMPAEEHCAIVTVPFDSLSAGQQKILTSYHLFRNCSEPLHAFNARVINRAMHGEIHAKPFRDVFNDLTAQKKLIDADAVCAPVAGVTEQQSKTQSYAVMGELIDARERALGRPLTDQEVPPIAMLFHRPYMPIRGFTQPAVTPLCLPKELEPVSRAPVP